MAISLAHATRLHLLMGPISLTAVDEYWECIMELPACCPFTHRRVGCSSVKTNPMSTSCPLSNSLSENNGWDQWFITRMLEEDETVASHVPHSPRQMGTESRTAGCSSQLGSSGEDSLPSQKDHLNL